MLDVRERKPRLQEEHRNAEPHEAQHGRHERRARFGEKQHGHSGTPALRAGDGLRTSGERRELRVVRGVVSHRPERHAIGGGCERPADARGGVHAALARRRAGEARATKGSVMTSRIAATRPASSGANTVISAAPTSGTVRLSLPPVETASTTVIAVA